MSYQIRITKIENVERKITEWNKVADSGNPKDKGAVYEYVPTIVVKTIETEVLKMEVEAVNIKNIVDAIFNNN